jgi:small GTP-binding protein
MTLEQKIAALEDMIRKAPGHKGAENLRAELRTRLKKFKEKSEKSKKVGAGKKGLKKEGYQVALVGKASSGKSSLLAALTNARPLISPHPFTTKELEVGSMEYEGARAQVVDIPSAEGAGFDIGLANTADCILLVFDATNPNFNETLIFLVKLLSLARGSKILVFNKIDLLDSNSLRKLKERCKSRRIDALFVSALLKEGLLDLKKRIFENMKVIRVYMKEPGKPPSSIPVVLRVGSSVRDVAESIRNGFSKTVKETRITG